MKTSQNGEKEFADSGQSGRISEVLGVDVITRDAPTHARVSRARSVLIVEQFERSPDAAAVTCCYMNVAVLAKARTNG